MKIISRKEAKALGLKRYFTGEPCKHGHVYERYCYSRKCAECTVFLASKWKSENKNKVSEYNRMYNQKNREDRIKKDRDRYLNNIHLMREKAKIRSRKMTLALHVMNRLGVQI